MTERVTVRRRLQVGTVSAGICALGWVSIRASEPHTLAATWWPCAGICVVVMLLTPRAQRATMAGGLLVGLYAANLLGGRGPLLSGLYAVADLAETLIIAGLVCRYGRRPWSITRGRLLWLLLWSGLVGTTLSVAAVYLLDPVFGLGRSLDGALALIPSHLAAVWLCTTVVFSWRDRSGRTAGLGELAIQSLLLAAAGFAVFGLNDAQPLSFATLPLIVWGAMRFGVRLVSLQLLAFSLLLSTLTRTGHGTFSERYLQGYRLDGTLCELYVCCLILTAMPLAIGVAQRDRSVRKLVESGRLFRSYFTDSTVPMLALSGAAEGMRIVEANNAAAELLDAPRVRLQGLALDEVLTAHDDLQTQARTIESGELAGWRGAVKIAGKPEVRAAMAISPLHLDGTDVRLSAQLADTTASHQARSQLRAEKDFSKALLDISGNLIIVTDMIGTVLSVNRATTEITGWASEQLVGRLLWERLATRRRLAGAEDWFVRLRSGSGDPSGMLLEVPTADGGLRYLVVRSGRVVDDQGAASHVVLVGVDITSERDSAGLVVHLLRAATTTALVGTDRHGRVTIFNSGAESMLGYDADQAAMMRFPDFLVPSEIVEHALSTGAQPGFASIVSRLDHGLEAETRDWTWVNVSGERIQVSMTGQRVTNSFGAPIGYLFVAQDVTESRRSQELLLQALEHERAASETLRALDRAKNSFVSTVSHELRTPMSSIVGYTELLQDGLVGPLSDQQLELLDAIARNGERLRGLANDLLMLASLDEGTTSMRAEHLDLCEIVRQAHLESAAARGGRELQLNLDLPDCPVYVDGDATHLHRALHNLLSNAVKFTPAGGAITVSLQPCDGLVVLSVADTGIGIPAAEVDEVFTRFFRATSAEDSAIQGTGLGLSIVHSIVSAHAGTIDVRSLEGSGTTFTIRLPAA